VKTTIELPDALFLRAKTVAQLRRSTLKQLVIEGLERVTAPETEENSDSMTPEEAEFMEIRRWRFCSHRNFMQGVITKVVPLKHRDTSILYLTKPFQP
jgi:hypothetical protein